MKIAGQAVKGAASKTRSCVGPHPACILFNMCSIVAIDVQYTRETAVIGAVMFGMWQQEMSDAEWLCSLEGVEPYTAGRFYRRELPCLLSALERSPRTPHQVVIDGYVWLSNDGRPGLGAHLFKELGGKVPVVGVAKTMFKSAPAVRLLRGKSRSPLFVTAEGCDPIAAAAHVSVMAGQHRIPTLLKRADQLARGICNPASI